MVLIVCGGFSWGHQYKTVFYKNLIWGASLESISGTGHFFRIFQSYSKLDAHILSNLIGARSDKFDKSNHFQNPKGGFVRHYLHVCLSAFKIFKVILNSFENSVPWYNCGVWFFSVSLFGEESEAERKHYLILHERFSHFMLFYSFFTLGR